MTAEPCAHDVRWLAPRGGDDPRCIRCNLEAVQVVIEQADIITTLRARAEQAEQERDEARQELDDRYGSSTTRRTMQATIATLETERNAAVAKWMNSDLTRYDRLREAAREVVRLYRSEEIDGDTGDGCHALRKLAEETTQKPAGGGPSEGGR